jgi:quinolinate synthase
MIDKEIVALIKEALQHVAACPNCSACKRMAEATLESIDEILEEPEKKEELVAAQ